ncbi:hypothetical protein K2V58_12325 [Staphylococcus arlettae]|uniref:hypothetical protein n=1 Tax=Staphylococcus arlettae TaxID=29378 RepID=UPI001E54D13C|nr:hypothetical protein [Staphylococcus arlettae]MCD8835054.1 hypothetical protein [Staphylococcus arlettae]
MEELTPGEIQCNECNGISELKILSERNSPISKTINCVYCGNVLGVIETPNKIECIEIPKRK